MRLIDSEPLIKFITNGLNSGEFGNDAVQILTEIEYAPTIEAYTPEEIAKIAQYGKTAYSQRVCLYNCKIGHPNLMVSEYGIKSLARAMKEDPKCS